MANVDLGSLFSESFRLIRKRWGTYLGIHFFLTLPIVLIGAVAFVLQLDLYAEMIRAIGGGGPMPMPRTNGLGGFVGLLLYPAMIVVYPTVAVATTRFALDQLAGVERSVASILVASARPILWIMLMDTVLVVIVYIGCICCLLPGIAMALLTVGILGVQTAALCDDSIDWFEAARRSKYLTANHAGTMIGGLFAWVGIYLAMGLVVASIGGVVFAAVNGGFRLDGERLALAIGLGYAVAVLLLFVPMSLLMSQWYVWRAVAYHRLARPAAAPAGDVANVFA